MVRSVDCVIFSTDVSLKALLIASKDPRYHHVLEKTHLLVQSSRPKGTAQGVKAHEVRFFSGHLIVLQRRMAGSPHFWMLLIYVFTLLNAHGSLIL